MVKVKCLMRIRDEQGNVVGYRLEDNLKRKQDIKAESLKKALLENKIDVINLTLNQEGDIVTKTFGHKKSDLDKLMIKAKMLGKYEFNRGLHYLYITDDYTIVYIPEETKIIWKFAFEKINGTLKLIGGKGLENVFEIFASCCACTVDISELDVSHLTELDGMFYMCDSELVGLDKMDTSNVLSMRAMFHWCQSDTLDLSRFNTSNVQDMRDMFRGCKAYRLDLTSFDTSKVKDMSAMFYMCKSHEIDISSFNFYEVETVHHILSECSSNIRYPVDISRISSEIGKSNKS